MPQLPDQPTAWLNGEYLAADRLVIQIDDLGFLQGATAVERLRTWDQRLPVVDRHLQRFQSSASALHLQSLPTNDQLREILQTLLDQFRSTNSQADVGFTIFATAGRLATKAPTVAVHYHLLDQERLNGYWMHGQPLIITDVVQPPPECWPREIKVRSRLHYYLADAAARQQDPRAIGALRDTDGSITEASTCNIFLAAHNLLVAPPQGRVLPGIMGEIVSQIATKLGYSIERRPIWPEELTQHSVWLTGSEGGLWFASSIDGKPQPENKQLRLLQQALREFLVNKN